MTEALEQTPRMQITVADTPAPPWTGLKFTCEKCQGEFQLEAADPCSLRLVLNDHLKTHNTPPCPTEGCGQINVVTT
jgi:hypothetical protein